ncbi:MAG: hypothetical protein FJX75_00565 [Armatimonadetes bacterium]|nr:hypothetical protein [Armatimonadota bacterium]
MVASTYAEPVPAQRTSAALWAGAALVHVGFAALAVSTVWTAQPLTALGLYERYAIALVGAILVVFALVSRGRLASSTPGKLLCALGAGMCLRIAVDPTFEKIPTIGSALPMWALNAYPGLPTVGWLLAGLGALVWWLGGGRADDARPYRGVAVVAGLVLMAVTLVVGAALRAAGYEVPMYDNMLLIWQTLGVVVTLVVAMSVCGRRGFGPWPMVLLGAGLLGHVIRTFIAPPPT